MEKAGRYWDGSGFNATDSSKLGGVAAEGYATLTGNQTFAGDKTFTGELILPTTPGTTNNSIWIA